MIIKEIPPKTLKDCIVAIVIDVGAKQKPANASMRIPKIRYPAEYTGSKFLVMNGHILFLI